MATTERDYEAAAREIVGDCRYGGRVSCAVALSKANCDPCRAAERIAAALRRVADEAGARGAERAYRDAAAIARSFAANIVGDPQSDELSADEADELHAMSEAATEVALAIERKCTTTAPGGGGREGA